MYLFIIIQLFLTPVWETHGPYGGECICIAIDPNDTLCMYAGTGNPELITTNGDGVYVSTDGGENWNHTSLSSTFVWDIAVDSHGEVYAATRGYGIFKSTDRGTTWNSINNGLSCLYISDIAIEPLDDSVVYVGTGDKFYGSVWDWSMDGIYKSTDRGETWSRLGLDGTTVSSIVVHPIAPETLYAAVYDVPWDDTSSNVGIYKSCDYGVTWMYKADIAANDLVIDLVNPNRIYAARKWDWDHFWKSTDGGETWTYCYMGIFSNEIRTIAIEPFNDSIIYMGCALYPTMDEKFGGIYKSIDAGDTWSKVMVGMPDEPVHSIVISTDNPDKVYATCSGPGVYKSIDKGETWEWSSNAMRLQIVTDLSSANEDIFAATRSGVYKRERSSEVWHNRSSGIGQVRTMCIAAAPPAPDTIYLGTFVGAGPTPSYRSFDGGETWTGCAGGGICHIQVNPLNPSVYYAVEKFNFRKVYKSTDAGSTVTTILDTTSPGCVAIDPFDTSIVYVGGGFGSAWVLKTVDGGTSWISISQGLDSGFVCDIKLDNFNEDILYAVVNADLFGWEGNGKLFRYNGDLWERVGVDLPELPFSSLEVDPVLQNVLYIGTYGGGVYRSLDGGIVWNELNEGLGNLFVNCIMLDPLDHTKIYAGTNAGVYSISSPPGIEEESVVSLSFLAVSPNPFREKTVISHQLSVIGDQPITLSIYDLTGRLVNRFTIFDSRLTSIVWNGRDDSSNSLPPGVYFVRLESGKTKYKAEKIVKLR